MTHGSTDDLKTANTERLLPSYPLWCIDEVETATFDDTGYGDIDTAVERFAVSADTDSAALDCVGLIERRLRQEGWTTRDLYAALLQASLLSYQSSRDAQDKYGSRYINSTPSDYKHNCPWNDWTPPSKSIELFQAAAEASANKSDIVLRRVRVRLSPFETLMQSSLIAFASIEMGNSGSCLRLRRGATIIGSMTLSSLKTERIGDLVIGLLADEGSLAGVPAIPTTPSIYLHFENRTRVTKFCALVS
jgi:hypothetical protein